MLIPSLLCIIRSCSHTYATVSTCGGVHMFPVYKHWLFCRKRWHVWFQGMDLQIILTHCSKSCHWSNVLTSINVWLTDSCSAIISMIYPISLKDILPRSLTCMIIEQGRMNAKHVKSDLGKTSVSYRGALFWIMIRNNGTNTDVSEATLTKSLKKCTVNGSL